MSVADAVARIRRWGEARDWRGHDPYDALNSPLVPFLTAGTSLGRRLLTQAVKLSPVNLRPLLRIPREHNPMAIALVASGYARLAAAGDDTAAAPARRWLDWLVANHTGGREGLAWGYHFEVQTRVFGYARGEPNAIATSFAGHALVDGLELVGDGRCADWVGDVARFVVTRLLREGDRPYFRYLTREDELVHNANVLVAGFLARAARAVDDASLAAPVAGTVATTLAAQRPDGAWPYAEEPGHEWVDNFHTGYVLESLAYCVDRAPAAREPLERGIEYWARELFLPDGTPKYFPDRVYPLDAQCYAQAVETWLAVRGSRDDALERARTGARLLVERMLDPSGFVWFQQRGRWTNRVPLIRWTTATSFRALAGLRLADA